MSADKPMSKRAQADNRFVTAKLMLRQVEDLYDRLGEGAFSEAQAIKSVLEVIDQQPLDLPAVAARIEDQMKRFKGPGDWKESAVLVTAWALVVQAIKLNKEAAAEPDDIGPFWLTWTKDRDFTIGDADTTLPGDAA